MNKKIPTILSAAVILLSGCSYSSFRNDYQTTQTTDIYLNGLMNNTHTVESAKGVDEEIPEGMTNKHIARIKRIKPEGDETVLAFYSYDEAGRQTAVTVGKNSLIKGYNSFGEIDFEEEYIDYIRSSYTVYNYDEKNHLISKTKLSADDERLNSYSWTYADGEDRIISEEYTDLVVPKSSYIHDYKYITAEDGRLFISISDSKTGLEVGESSYLDNSVSKPLDIFRMDENGNYISADFNGYDDKGELTYRYSMTAENGKYYISAYIYKDEDDLYDFDTNTTGNIYDIIGADRDEDIGGITVYYVYNNGHFRKKRTYNSMGECTGWTVFTYSGKTNLLMRSEECRYSETYYENTLNLETRYSYDSYGNVISAKLYAGELLVETLIYNYQVIPGAFCEPYTVEPATDF